jgi:hypothetical protein
VQAGSGYPSDHFTKLTVERCASRRLAARSRGRRVMASKSSARGPQRPAKRPLERLGGQRKDDPNFLKVLPDPHRVEEGSRASHCGCTWTETTTERRVRPPRPAEEEAGKVGPGTCPRQPRTTAVPLRGRRDDTLADVPVADRATLQRV